MLTSYTCPPVHDEAKLTKQNNLNPIIIIIFAETDAIVNFCKFTLQVRLIFCVYQSIFFRKIIKKTFLVFPEDTFWHRRLKLFKWSCLPARFPIPYRGVFTDFVKLQNFFYQECFYFWHALTVCLFLRLALAVLSF